MKMEKLLVNRGNFIIRYAEKDDCPNMWKLVKELADYLKSSDKLLIGVETLEKYGFETNPPMYRCLVVEEVQQVSNTHNGKNVINKAPELVAYALFTHTFSTWTGRGMYLEDIYIREAYRGMGVGSMLMKQIAKEALAANCNVLTLFVFRSNEMKKIFKSKGAVNLTQEDEFEYYEFDKRSLINLMDN